MKTWAVEIRLHETETMWLSYKIKAETKEIAITKGLRYVDIKCDAWYLVKVSEIRGEPS